MSRRAIVAVGCHPHFFDVALAAQEAGHPGRLYTAMYDKPGSLAGRLVRLPPWIRRRWPVIERLRGRRKDALDPERVYPVNHAEILPRLSAPVVSRMYRWRMHRRLVDAHGAHSLLPTDAAVMGSWGGSRRTFERARAMGIHTLLDIPYINLSELRELWNRELTVLNLEPEPSVVDPELATFTAELALADTIVVGLDRYRRSAVIAGADPRKVRVVPYGFEVSRFSYVSRPRRTTFTVLYVGPINPTKGLHYLIQAFERASIPGSTLHLVGSVDPRTAVYFEAAMARLGSTLRHQPWVMHSELIHAYASADVFAFPSMVGGIGVATCEAMATGLPVITTDGDVLLRPDVDGLVVAERDVEALVRALQDLASNARRRIELGSSASERVKSFTRQSFRQALGSLFTEIIASASHGAPVEATGA